jgi:uncharacterized protein
VKKRLELIVKLAERCNIACTYCYYFENEERSALSRPARLTDYAANQLIFRIDEYLRSHVHNQVRVIFHGGEPLLYGKERFSALCGKLRELEHWARVELCIQTNAILVDKEWIDIFSEFSIGVGVSIDGPDKIHNLNRLDRNGRPTHQATISGVKQLVAASREDKIRPPGALVVMQPNTSVVDIYNHIVYELDIKILDFLLPDATWDSYTETRWAGPYLVELLGHWMANYPSEVNIRLIKSVLSLLLGGESFLGGFGPQSATALTILSNGEINGDDFLRPCGDEVVFLSSNIFENSLSESIRRCEYRMQSMLAEKLPDDCGGCPFAKICCGGQLTHRYSKTKLFNNKTIYCQDLKDLYTAACEALVQSDISPTDIECVLRGRIDKKTSAAGIPIG